MESPENGYLLFFKNSTLRSYWDTFYDRLTSTYSEEEMERYLMIYSPVDEGDFDFDEQDATGRTHLLIENEKELMRLFYEAMNRAKRTPKDLYSIKDLGMEGDSEFYARLHFSDRHDLAVFSYFFSGGIAEWKRGIDHDLETKGWKYDHEEKETDDEGSVEYSFIYKPTYNLVEQWSNERLKLAEAEQRWLTELERIVKIKLEDERVAGMKSKTPIDTPSFGLDGGHVASLNLSGLGLNNIPDFVRIFPRLTQLYLIDNNISTLPPWFNDLALKCRISLDGNPVFESPEYFDSVSDLSPDDTSLIWKEEKTSLLELSRILGPSQERYSRDLTIPGKGFWNFSCSQGRVRSLTIFNLNIQTLPEAVSRLKYLEMLELNANLLTDLPSSIASLVHLMNLDISDNRFTRIPEVLYKIPALETVNVGNSRVYGFKTLIEDIQGNDLTDFQKKGEHMLGHFKITGISLNRAFQGGTQFSYHFVPDFSQSNDQIAESMVEWAKKNDIFPLSHTVAENTVWHDYYGSLFDRIDYKTKLNELAWIGDLAYRKSQKEYGELKKKQDKEVPRWAKEIEQWAKKKYDKKVTKGMIDEWLTLNDVFLYQKKLKETIYHLINKT